MEKRLSGARGALLLAAALAAAAPPDRPASAAPLTVGDVVVAVRGVGEGSLGADLGDITAILESIVASDPVQGKTPADLGPLLVELTAALSGLPDPQFLAVAFLDFYEVAGPEIGGAYTFRAAMRLAEPTEDALGWAPAPGACSEVSGAALPEAPGSDWYDLWTDPVTLADLALGAETVTLRDFTLDALLAADAFDERTFLLQGEADLTGATTDPAGLLALFGVQAIYVNGWSLTEAERALPGVGEVLGSACP